MQEASNLTSKRMQAGEIDKTPWVSAIIPFLNAEQFLQEAIESVFAQTYRAWELLLVDDGSSDGSTAIARHYAEQYPERVRYLEHSGHQNRGVSAARNLGIRHAQGEYIALLDADDVWLPHKLEEQVGILESQPEAGMVYGLSEYWYSWTGRQEDQHRDLVYDLGVPPNTLIQPPMLILWFFLEQKAVIPGPTDILVRREVIEHVGGFEENFQLYEDQSFYAKICLRAPVFAASACWDRYRLHPNSAYSVTQKTGQEYSTRLFFLNWLAGYLSAQGLKDPKIWQALRKELWRCRHPNFSRLLRRGQYCMLVIARRTLPFPVRHWLWAKWTGIDYTPPVGWVRFGSLRRVTPLSREFGYDRGLPIDRYYIERFLSKNGSDIRGQVLEIADNTYTHRFGGERVTASDVLHLEVGHPKATIVGDLTCADHIPSDSFDCMILTQTLQFIYDMPAVLRTVKRILKPGGVVLATLPGISPISRYDTERWGHFWAFTTESARRLFEEVFPTANIKIEAHGNVLAATAFLYGMASQELHQRELDDHDPDYQLIVTVRARKPVNGYGTTS
jgi:glycosyltransferase involved in cell wall biosynthesis